MQAGFLAIVLLNIFFEAHHTKDNSLAVENPHRWFTNQSEMVIV